MQRSTAKGDGTKDPKKGPDEGTWKRVTSGALLFLLLLALAGWVASCAGEPGGATAAHFWTLAPVPGPEDLVVDPRHQRILASSRHLREKPEPNGAVWSVPLDPATGEEARELPLVGRDGCSFRPHGMDLVEAPDPVAAPYHHQLLYVVNHHAPEDGGRGDSCLLEAEPGEAATSVEVFVVEADRLRFLQRLADPEVLIGGNDLVALPDGDVWLTMPPSTTRKLLLESLGWGYLSRLAHFRCRGRNGASREGERAGVAAEALRCSGEWTELKPAAVEDGAGEPRRPRYVNGIAWKPGNQSGEKSGEPDLLVVASTFGHALFVYGICDFGGQGPSLHPLRLLGEDELRGADNLTWQDVAKDTLLVAGHPDSRRFLQHKSSPRNPSPWEVWSVPLDGNGEQRLLRGSGERVSAVSVAVPVEGDLVLGQVFDPGVVRSRVGPGAESGTAGSRQPDRPARGREGGGE